MKTSLFLLVTVISCFAGGLTAQAATYPYSDFIKGLEKVTSTQYSNEAYTLFYIDGEAVYGSSVTAKGKVQLQADGEGYDSISSVKGVEAGEDEVIAVTMDFVRKGDMIYIRFKNPGDKDLKGKWIALNATEYKQFGDVLGVPNLFDAAEVSNMSEQELNVLLKTVALAEKHDLFVEYKKPKTKSKKTITYYLEIDPEKAAAYYQELDTVLTDEEEKESILGITGFKEAAKNPFFLEELAEESATTLTFDLATMSPIAYGDYLVLPAYGTRKAVVEIGTSFTFSKVNKKVAVTIPTKTISAKQALALLKN